MSPRKWWRRRRRMKLRTKAAEANRHEPLREFVYLDDVSVYSLLASRIGALATDFTESESSSLNTEIKGAGGVATPVAKAQVSSSVRAAASSGAQVMRKATVQSTFRELYGYIRHGLVMSVALEGDPPRIRDVDELRAEAARESPWVINPSRLSRGEVLEIQVALDADDTFRASTILSTLFGFIREVPQLPSTVDRQAFTDAITGMRLLDGLLGGVVPVRGRALHYEHVEVDGEDLVVHRRVFEQLEAAVVRRPLVVVGICEAELFWRDLRRVLFSSSRFRMLCRIGADGIAREWRPVKLTDVLEGVVPGLEGIIDEIPAMLAHVKEHSDDDDPEERMRGALTVYAVDLCSHYGQDVGEDDLRELGVPTTQASGGAVRFKQRRAAFDELTASLAGTFDFEVDPVVATRLRTAALIESHVVDLGGGTEGSDIATGSRPQAARFLDCEIVAIYW